MRSLETCGQQRGGSDQTIRVNKGQLKLSNTGGLATDERMMLAGVRDDDDARLSYVAEEEHDVQRDSATNVERGDALRWFMFPSEASALLTSAPPPPLAAPLLRRRCFHRQVCLTVYLIHSSHPQ